MTEPRPADKFAIVPIYADSSGSEVKFPNAIMTGDMSAVMARVKDSKQMREDLRISNEADQVRRDKAALKVREDALRADEANFSAAVESVQDALISQFSAKVDALAARMDAIEAERSRDPDDDLLPSPPGTPVSPGSPVPDDGNLQSPIAAKDPDPDTPHTTPRPPVAEEDQNPVGG
jgi:hypothetical protein